MTEFKKCECPYEAGKCPFNDNTIELPIDSFHKSINRGKPYSDPRCKNLYSHLRKVRKENNGEYPYEMNVLLKNWDKIDPEGTRTCRKCEINKPLNKFHNKNSKGDKHVICIECKKIDRIEFLENNPEKKIEYNEKQTEKLREMMINNPEKYEERKQKSIEWNRNLSLEKKLLKSTLYHSKDKENNLDLDYIKILLEENNYCCPVFGIKYDQNNRDARAEIDRIDNDKGYIKGNVIIVSGKVNRIKSNLKIQELNEISNFYNKLVGG